MTPTPLTPAICTLTGPRVRLEPLTVAHAPGLLAAALACPAGTFQYTTRTVPAELTLDAFQAFIALHCSWWPEWQPFAVVDATTGAVLGSTSYLEIRPAHRGLEIGATWLTTRVHGSGINTEMKYLMLEHAFETLGAIRVQLKTHHLNLRSQRAIEKLGATREGVLRNHLIMADGSIRHSVYYSIITEEWPAIKPRLAAQVFG